LSLLFSRFSETERVEHVKEVLEAVEKKELSLDGLILAEIDGDPVGVVLFIMQPDQTAYVWPPVIPDHPLSEGIGRAILEELRSRIDKAGAWLGQCIVDPEAANEREVLNRNGFIHLADLRYLSRSLNDPLPKRTSTPFQTVSYKPASRFSRERFANLLDRTYVGTLDCPGLDGWRSSEEALESHLQVGEFDPQLWRVYRVGSDDVGVLLFGNHPDRKAWEVAYMGVVPEFRGKGYAHGMLLCGLYEASEASCETVLLAVDDKNHYARKIYDNLGFDELTVRSVYVCRGKQYRIDN